ncbi:hypothetical protein F5Y10DRAFT_272763 [Nemania abortiva]|nr:hypothetical protein F5Y10DRAFT_272763 [Nemania abortiva]
MPDLRDTPSRREARKNKPSWMRLVFSIRNAIEMASSRYTFLIPALDCRLNLVANRNKNKPRSRLEKLPNEIKLEVISWISEVRSIFSLALTGPEFCAFVVTHESTIARDVITRHIHPDLLSLAVADHVAAKSSFNIHLNNCLDMNKAVAMSSSRSNSIVRFVEEYRRGNFTLKKQHKKGLRLYEAAEYFDSYNIMCDYAETLSGVATGLVPKHVEFPGPIVSPMVLLRYVKALYVMQLVSYLFSWSGRNAPRSVYRAWGVFWSCFFPWEYGQMCCANTFLHVHVAVLTGKQMLISHFLGKKMIWRFVNFQGPKRLWTLEKKDVPGAMEAAFESFSSCNHYQFISIAFPAPDYEMQTHFEKIARKLDEADGDALGAFGDFHLGPMKMWYRNLVWGKMLEAKGNFFCIFCLTKAGYPFWDDLRPEEDPSIVCHMNTASLERHKTAQENPDSPGSGVTRFRPEACTCLLSQPYLPDV